MRKKINKKIIKKASRKLKKGKQLLFTFGAMDSQRGRISMLIVLIIFVLTYLTLQHMIAEDKDLYATARPQVRIITPLEKQITSLVKGYPIEKMTPYIAMQDPKVAAFIIGIAKKESNWGKRRPVFAGNDCYNYWGFRMKAEKMGSGGHTCFNSPKEAVDTIALRINELVNEENINTPKKMVIWKCGYGCQDQPKNLSEEKWIRDVNIYYSKFEDYL